MGKITEIDVDQMAKSMDELILATEELLDSIHLPMSMFLKAHWDVVAVIRNHREKFNGKIQNSQRNGNPDTDT